MPFSGLLDLVKGNASVTRRQVCQIGAVLGAWLSSPGPFQARDAFAQGGLLRKEVKPMRLPPPILDGKVSVEKAIKERRTVRSFTSRALTAQQLSQILWAAQGITEEGGNKRAAPSGGALYPADVYAVTGKNKIEEMPAGVYHYHPVNHSLDKIVEGDKRTEIAVACLRQMWMASAPVLFVVTVEYRRITMKYGERGIQYAQMEVGHIGQNIFLQALALGLAAGIVGAFDDQAVARATYARKNHEPLIIMPVGWRG